VSYYLESDREQVVRKTRLLVQSVEKRDWPTMQSLLDADVTVIVLEGREMVVEVTRLSVEAAGLQSARITTLAPRPSTGGFYVTMQVKGDFKDGTSLTNWELAWRQSGEEWLLQDARFLGGPGLDERAVERHLRRR
jgi:hypothetical protein